MQTENQQDNIFYLAFASIMVFLKKDNHTLFDAVEKTIRHYPAHRMWINLDNVISAWLTIKHGYQGKDDGLEENIYERAFGTVVTILQATNHSLFNMEHFHENYTEDVPEISVIQHAWRIWCDQNCCIATPEEFHKFKKYGEDSKEENSND